MQNLVSFIHRHFLLILVGAYVLAAVTPDFGLRIRDVQICKIQWLNHESVKISLPLLMLSFLIFNAGLGIKIQEVKALASRPLVIICGFLANLAVPVILILALKGLTELWHNNDEMQNLLTGLAMIVSMPIAGSSTAWAQNANGNLSLSLGLILFSTILSPWTTPIVLHIFGHITKGDYSEDLIELSKQGTSSFLTISVVIPALTGILVHFLCGEKRVNKLKPFLKLTNYIVLLLLNYSNASTSLPQTLKESDWDFLFIVILTTVLLCTAAFVTGHLVAKLLQTDSAERASLLFGLGMNNNGTGLVLVTTALADHTNVLLPIISYTLVQQIIAAYVDRKFFTTR